MKSNLALVLTCIFLLAMPARAQTVTKVDNYIQYVPGVMSVCLKLVGVQSENTFGDIVLRAGLSFVSEAAICNSLKYTIKEERPDGSARNSFPSGHTYTAFTGAELTRMDYGWGWGAAAYTFATATGVLRVVNHRHWWWDVAGGAVLGIGTAHLGNWLTPKVKRLFGNGKSDAQVAFAPTGLIVIF